MARGGLLCWSIWLDGGHDFHDLFVDVAWNNERHGCCPLVLVLLYYVLVVVA